MLTEFQKKKLAVLYSMYDADKNGVIELADFYVLLDKYAEVRGWEPGSPEYEVLKSQLVSRWHTMQEAADTNRDNQISRSEWLVYIDNMLSSPATFDAEVTKIVAAIFAIFDLDGNGSLELEEYRQLYRATGIDEAFADENFGRLDLSNNGHISKEQHLELFRQFFYSQDPDSPGNWVLGPY